MSNTYELFIPAVLPGSTRDSSDSKNSRADCATRGRLHHSGAGSTATRGGLRDEGRKAASATAASGTAAQTYIEVRRSIVSASAPSATAAIPPRPIDIPIDRPDASPIRRGRYSWLMTIVTPNVPITQAPTKASATAP